MCIKIYDLSIAKKRKSDDIIIMMFWEIDLEKARIPRKMKQSSKSYVKNL